MENKAHADPFALSSTTSALPPLSSRPPAAARTPQQRTNLGESPPPQIGGSSGSSLLDMPAATATESAKTATQPPQSGSGSHVYPDGSAYEGEWQGGQHHGEGLLYFAGSGNVYIGTFARGECEGSGVMVYADGDVFAGHWSRGACDGHGVFLSRGQTTTGIWNQGKLLPGSSTITEGNARVNELPAIAVAKARAFSAMASAVHSHVRLSRTGSGTQFSPQQARQNTGGSNFEGGPLDFAGPLNTSQKSPNRTPRRSPQTPQLEMPHHQRMTSLELDIPNTEVGPTTSGNAKSSVKRRLRASTYLAPPGGEDLGSISGPVTPLHSQNRRSPVPALTNTSMVIGGDSASNPSFATPAAAQSTGPSAPVGPTSSFAAAAAGSGAGAIQTAMISTSEGPTPITEVLFAATGPSYNVMIPLATFMRHFAIFLFPFLSLPHIPMCPFKISFLQQEREYVVSGAALRIDFEPPKSAVYWSCLAVASCWIAVILADQHGNVNRLTGVTYTEIVAPIALMVVFAGMQAGYHSAHRIAHALERLDRNLFPRIASFVANAVDSQSSVCIYTWDEEGNSRVTNAHYSYRWFGISLLVAGLSAFTIPVYRAAYGESAFGDDALERSAMALAIVAMFTTTLGVTYYALKISDMQRQIRSQMDTLSRLCYMKGTSIARPTEHRRFKFDLDAPIQTSNIFDGFVGWYVTRCFVLYSSVCSNHLARATSMSAFAFFMLGVYVVSITDGIYAASTGRLEESGDYLNPAHVLGAIGVIFWGSILSRYCYVCAMTERLRGHHLYLTDVAALYQQSVLHDSNAAGIVQLCRSMVEMHDYRPELLGLRVTRITFVIVLLLQLGSLASLATQIVQGARFGRSS